jgi:hypothetical protein
MVASPRMVYLDSAMVMKSDLKKRADWERMYPGKVLGMELIWKKEEFVRIQLSSPKLRM